MNWKIIIPWVIIAILGTLQLKQALTPTSKPDNTNLNIALQAKDDLIKEVKENDQRWREHYNNDIAESKRVDSLLIQRSKVNTIKYAQVPVNVANLNNEELRAAVNDY